MIVFIIATNVIKRILLSCSNRNLTKYYSFWRKLLYKYLMCIQINEQEENSKQNNDNIFNIKQKCKQTNF